VMELWQTFILSVIDLLRWPVTVVVVAYIFWDILKETWRA